MSVVVVVVVGVFFFQAEDGIRDVAVTGVQTCALPISWSRWTCMCAAKGGHIQVLQWARTKGCPWDAQTCNFAALAGHLEILQWEIGRASCRERV